jgi:hypothetical protein
MNKKSRPYCRSTRPAAMAYTAPHSMKCTSTRKMCVGTAHSASGRWLSSVSKPYRTPPVPCRTPPGGRTRASST